MPIVKYCQTQHNPFVQSKQIQLCSLRYYTETDNEFIRDVEESKIDRSLNARTSEVVTGNQLGKLFGASISGNGTVRFSGRAVKHSSSVPPAYIFCTSMASSPNIQQAQSLGYDSWYVVTNPQEFATKIAGVLNGLLQGANRVQAYYGNVSYEDEKEVAFSKVAEYADSLRTFDPKIYFLKRRVSSENPNKSYATDAEFRFVFVPIARGGGSVTEWPDRILLDVTELIGYLEPDKCGV